MGQIQHISWTVFFSRSPTAGSQLQLKTALHLERVWGQCSGVAGAVPLCGPSRCPGGKKSLFPVSTEADCDPLAHCCLFSLTPFWVG